MRRHQLYGIQDEIKSLLEAATREEALEFLFNIADWANTEYERLLMEPDCEMQDYDNVE